MDWRERARRDAFDAVVVEVYEPVQRYLRRRCRDEDVDEVLNDVLLALWRRIDDTPPGRALPWAYGISRHCLDNHRRGGRRRLRLADRLRSAAEPRPQVDWTSPEECALQEALDRLPERDREVLRLWAWERLEPREIAEVLGVTPTAVSVRLTRLHHRLADEIVGKDRRPSGHESVDPAEAKDR